MLEIGIPENSFSEEQKNNKYNHEQERRHTSHCFAYLLGSLPKLSA